ncbi:ubiquitin-conjugating enzyme E2 D4-like [Sycon ciliatum]|uniref:ubiquitin-conjugating enzyme E2 D4-like n=1 Tax=Sycon ciliatum TaxID=27933 RepID=UPI0031F68CEF
MADGAWISAETEDENYDQALVLGRKNIRNEFERLERNPPDGCYIKANHDDDFLYWEATVFGPKGSPYEGGVFDITLKCIDENPFVLPDVTFITKIYHPIVKRHSKICELSSRVDNKSVQLRISSAQSTDTPDRGGTFGPCACKAFHTQFTY